MALDLRGEIPFRFGVDTPTISHGAREKPRQYPRQLEPIIKARAGISMDATYARAPSLSILFRSILSIVVALATAKRQWVTRAASIYAR